ncbi:MAG: acyl-CoA thioesterase [Candidatus Protistobacter heckmanni]|nr:acyl-CoA thioesterase [Candidatus Protistobacter heckmanni]
MSKTTVFKVDVLFGDCDPAGIVFFPNFSKWMDASSLHFFMQCGVPPWRELTKSHGIIGTPLLEINTRFVQPATYGQTIEVHTSVEEWRSKVFIQKHTILRRDPEGETLICEGRETRAFCVRPPETPERIKAIAVPDFIKELCS